MPSTFGHETAIIITNGSEGADDVPRFQLIPASNRKSSHRTSDSGISMCHTCSCGGSNTTSANSYTGLMAPSCLTTAAAVPLITNYDSCNYLTPEIRAESSNSHYSDINNNGSSPTPSHSSHQAKTAYCYCSRCTSNGRNHPQQQQQQHRAKMYSKFKSASNAARAASRFESSLTARETETMFDHKPRDPSHHKTEHGCFRKSIPRMPLYVAIPCCIFNFFLPGSGTLIACFSILFGCRTEYGDAKRVKSFLIGILISLIQITTAIFVLGWVWSIMWGINFVKHSSQSSSEYDDSRGGSDGAFVVVVDDNGGGGSGSGGSVRRKSLRNSRQGSTSSHTQIL